jgi:hypothetical protein
LGRLGLDDQAATTEPMLERCLDRVEAATRCVGASGKSIDNHFDVGSDWSRLVWLIEPCDFSINTYTREAFDTKGFIKAIDIRFRTHIDGEGDEVSRAFGKVVDPFCDHRGISGLDIDPAVSTNTFAKTCKQNGEVFVDFSDGANGTSGRAFALPLSDSNGGRDAFNPVGVRLIETFEKLTGVSGKRLDVTSLPLSVQSVKSQ